MIENSMVIGDYYRNQTEAAPDVCAVCGDEEFDMKENSRGEKFCSSCTRPCALCGDWMLGEDGPKDSEGNEAHKACAEDL